MADGTDARRDDEQPVLELGLETRRLEAGGDDAIADVPAATPPVDDGTGLVAGNPGTGDPGVDGGDRRPGHGRSGRDDRPGTDDRLTAVCAVPVPEGVDPAAYHQDPTLSVPELVAQVATRFDLTEDAAALYLQLLALPDPTDANVARWTGWKPARLRQARAALAETDAELVVTKTRKLLDEDQVHIISGPMLAFEGLAMLDSVNEAGLPWVGQTGGNSAVGRCVIALAKQAGLRTLNVVRRPEVAAELKAKGIEFTMEPVEFRPGLWIFG